MITLSPRWIVIAAALALSPLAAAAQIGAQAKDLAATRAAGPIAPGDVWKKVLDKVGRDGEKGAADGFFTRALTVGTGDPKLDYAVHGIIVFYFVDANNNFKVTGVELSLERSALKTGTIRTDYWTMIAKPSGQVDQVVYKQRVDVPGDDVIPGVPVVVDLADPRVKARFDEMLEFWSTR
ncbi:MAG: hypothetical protein PHS14_08060 [Elusimicrobia bacterium]|nr:hypothetical protein [Elusimicrobiota bacterium]